MFLLLMMNGVRRAIQNIRMNDEEVDWLSQGGLAEWYAMMLFLNEDVTMHIHRIMCTNFMMSNAYDFPDISDVLDYIEVNTKDVEKELKKFRIRYYSQFAENSTNIPFEDFADFIVDWDPLNLNSYEEID